MMQMHQVRYFLALVQERNFSRAARCCGVAQSSLTRAIKVLEQELGGPLFQRRPEGTELTGCGVRVEPYFAAIWRCVEEIERGPGRVSSADRQSAKEIAHKLGLLPRSIAPKNAVSQKRNGSRSGSSI